MWYSLLTEFRKFKTILNNYDGNGVVDLRNHDFLGATTLLPLFNYMIKNNIYKYDPHPNIKDFCDRVLGKTDNKGTTIPFEELPKNISSEYFGDFPDKLRRLLTRYVDPEPYELLVYEMLSNIYDHSEFNNAFVLCQQYPRSKNKTTDICLIDDGISIPGNFEKEEFGFENDAEAILDAINGLSTKTEEGKYRGTGLNTATQISTLAYDEEILIASRKGVCHVKNNGAQLYTMRDNHLNGTFVSIRINNRSIEKLNKYYSKKKIIQKRRENFYIL